MTDRRLDAWLLAIAVSLALGCESRVSLGGRCESGAECTAPLACVGGRCREACTQGEDCPAGLRCVAGPTGLRACTLSVEETCGLGTPCESTLFTTCREGRCVTGCTNGDACVSGVCDTATGTCIEPISSGEGCAPSASASSRTIGDVVLGVSGARVERVTRWMDRGEPLTLTGTIATRLSVGVRAGGDRADGSLAPRVGTIVSLGPRDVGDELSALYLSLFDEAALPIVNPSLSSGCGFGATAATGLDDDLRFVALRPIPDDDAPTFAWILSDRDGASPTNLNSQPTYPTIPGGVAIFDGPDADGVRSLFALYYVEADATPRLGVIGEGFGRGNSTDRDLPSGFGAGPVSLSAVAGGMLLFDPDGGDTLLARCTDAMGTDHVPVVTLQPLTLESDLAPSLVRGANEGSYRAITSAHGCGALPIVEIACSADTCTLASATVAVPATGVLAMEASSWGDGTAILVRDARGARLVVLDDALAVVSDELVLPTDTLFQDVDPFTLREAHLATSVSGSIGALAVAGLYVDTDGGARVEVHALRVGAP